MTPEVPYPLHKPEPPVTYVELKSRTRRRWGLAAVIIMLLLMLVGLILAVVGAYGAIRLQTNKTAKFDNPVLHFAHGSIGADEGSGLPYWVWKALPRLFPDQFNGRLDYSAFGFLYRPNENGKPEDLPIGISKRNYQGVELVWFNCAVCHVGTWRTAENAEPHIEPGMPANNFDIYRFIRFILDAGVDERLAAESLLPAMQQAGARFGLFERLVWKFYVIPRVREGFIQRRTRLAAFIAAQKPWGPGRVDTFNPYKLVQMQTRYEALGASELHGASDFPAIFNQGPREGMELHWDGNNKSLDERNLSAALGAGVTVKSVKHDAIERVADWLKDLKPPASPHKVEAAATERGKALYMRSCAACHGWQNDDRYVFEGQHLGKVTPNSELKADSGRLDSYTEAFRERQINELFAGTKYQFKYFTKTDGYANMPLDGLWLRGPYLHNGSVPTLRALLAAPAERPKAYLRGGDVIDGKNGGFVSPGCDPSAPAPPRGLCYDTKIAGNGNGGHEYGTTLTASEKDDLLAYLLTF
jgi:hypothetical protein